jgi:hypothetical protein
MIWEFIKDSPAWRIAGWISLVYAAGWLVLTQGDKNGVAAGAPLLLYLGNSVALSLAPDTAFRCTFFDAALPIAGRQLWISKMIVLFGSLWLPVLAAAAVGIAVAGNPAVPFLNAAGGITVLYLCGQSFRIRQFHEPRWICSIILIVGGAAICVIDAVMADYGLRLLAGYLLIAAALFVVDLARVPKSFECAPEEPRAAAKPATVSSSTAHPAMVWLKILRPMWGWQALISIPVVWVSGGGVLIAIIAFAPVMMAMIKRMLVFLGHLPVSGRKLFWAMWAPLPAVILLGYEAAVHFPLPFYHRFPALEPRISAIVLALGMALFLIWVFLLQSVDGHRLRNIPAALRWAAIAIFPIVVDAAWILAPFDEAGHGSDPIPYYAIRLARGLPENPWLLAATLLIPLLGLYWLAERTFREMECALAGKPCAQPYLV